MATEAPPRRTWRAARWLLVGVLGVGGASAGAIAWLRTPAGNAWMLAEALDAADPPAGSLVIEGLETDLFTGATLRGVEVRDDAGTVLLHADAVTTSWRLGGLTGGVLRVPSLRVEGLRGEIGLAPDGTLDLAAVWGPSDDAPSPTYRGLGLDVIVDEMSVTAASFGFTTGGTRYGLTDATLVGAVALRGPAVEVTGVRLQAASTSEALGGGAASLGVDLRWVEERLYLPRVELALGAQRLEGHAILPGLDGDDPGVEARVTTLHLEPEALPWDVPVRGPIDGALDVDGTFATPRASLRLRAPAGELAVDASLDARVVPETWTLQLRAPSIDVGALVEDVPVGRARVALTLQGQGLDWPKGLSASGTAEVDLARVDIGEGRSVPVFVGGDVALREGHLVVDARRIAATAVTASGHVDADLEGARATMQLSRASADLGALGVYGVEGLDGDAELRGAFDVAWGGDAVEVEADTSLVARGLVTPGDVRAQEIHGPVRARWGANGGRVDGALDLRGLVVTDQVDVAEGRADVHLDLSPEGDPDGKVVVRAGATRLGPFSGDKAAIDMDLRWPSVAVRADVLRGDMPVLGLDAEADLAARTARAARFYADAGVGAPWHEDGVQRVRWSDDGLEEVHLRLRAAGERASSLVVDGEARTKGRVGLKAHAANVELATLRPFVGDALDGVSGVVSLEGDVEGTLARPVVRLRADVRDLAMEGSLRAADLEVRASGAGDAVAIEARLSDDARELATLDGSIPVSLAEENPGLRGDGPIDLRLVVRPADGTHWNRLLVEAPFPAPSRARGESGAKASGEVRLSGELHVTGTPSAPDTDLVATLDLPEDGTGPLRLEVDATTRGDVLELRAVAREQLRRRLEVTGTARTGLAIVARKLVAGDAPPPLDAVDTWLSELDLGVVPLALPASRLAELAGVPAGRIAGTVLGGVRVSGSPVAPAVEGALLLVDGTLGGVPVSPAQITVTPAEGGYDVLTELGFPGKGRGAAAGKLELSGFFPFDPADPDFARDGLRLDISGDAVPVAALAALSSDVRDAEGRVEVSGGVRGSLAAPVADLRFALADAAFTLPSTNVRYEDVGASLRFAGGELVLDDLHARTRRADTREGGDGTLRGTVRLAMDGFTPGAARGDLQLERAWLLALPDMLVRVREGKLALSGTWPKLKLRGATALEDARLTLDETFFSSNSGALALDPAIRVVRPQVEVLGARTATDDALLPRDLSLSIDLDLARAAFLDATMPMEEDLGAVMSGLASIQVLAQIDGQVKATGEQGDLAMAGQVLPLRGTARVLGKPFDIRGGTVSFTGKDTTNPVMDLDAVYQTTDYGAITVRIAGTADAPKITFSSETYPSTDDILSILIFNRPASEIGGGQGADALSMMVSALGGAVTSELGAAGSGAVDLFEVGTSGLRVGQRLGPKLFLVVSFDPFADPEEGSRMGLTLEWKLAPKVDAELSSDLEDTTSASVRWKKRF